jgi:hypothetical protein
MLDFEAQSNRLKPASFTILSKRRNPTNPVHPVNPVQDDFYKIESIHFFSDTLNFLQPKGVAPK